MSFFINSAMAADAGGSAIAGGGMGTMFLFAIIFLLFYMLIIRPQNKRAKTHKNMVDTLTVGDEVVTNGGIIGKIAKLDDTYLSVEIADKVVIRLQKSFISASLPKGTTKAIETSK